MDYSPNSIIPPRRGTPKPDPTDVVWKALPSLPDHITPEILNAVLLALRDSRLPDADDQMQMFLALIGYDLYLHGAPAVARTNAYMFESMGRGQSVVINRADEHRIRQALSRFRSKQPTWQFSLKVDPNDPYKMTLMRI